METKRLQELALAVFCLVALFTVWGLTQGWSWFMISIFDFWAFTMVFMASAYCLFLWDEKKGRTHDGSLVD
ncbi:hypothetical protein [Cerasicoccus frondis]|uniref:hypothetical protein n=1 Tax=Cerasicoccus frondis TaxID=490090 RepID=UPI002852AA44|nr:hypothetical protein [Cerasicoccus frondis]